MAKLEELRGEKIFIRLLHPIMDQPESEVVMAARLVDIEIGGIWIEGRALAETLQSTYKKPMPRTPIFFVPFAQIGWLLSFADYPYLSEKSLGLDPH